MRNELSIEYLALADTFGFVYGTARAGKGVWTINLMPPRSRWRGSMMLEGFAPDESAWRVFIDGDEIGVAADRAEAEAAVLRWLS